VRLVTARVEGGTRAARLDGEVLTLLPEPTVVEVLATERWQDRVAAATGAAVQLGSVGLDPVVRPARTVCVGLNYRSHILETGRAPPSHPTLFAKFPTTLTGPNDDIALTGESESVDWEVELGVVIGERASRVRVADAGSHIAGYTVVNDVSMRDWQRRTAQWMQGKNFDATTPVGPALVTPDELADARDLRLTCEVDGEVMQDARTSDLLFDPAAIVSYVSTFMALLPGDLIATGTPGGVGAARDPRVFLRPGQTVRSSIDGIGSCVNRIVDDVDAAVG
jgi:acylpyruvate hydrolase